MKMTKKAAHFISKMIASNEYIMMHFKPGTTRSDIEESLYKNAYNVAYFLSGIQLDGIYENIDDATWKSLEELYSLCLHPEDIIFYDIKGE